MVAVLQYRGTSRIRNRLLLGPYRRPLLRALRWSYGGGISYGPGTPVIQIGLDFAPCLPRLLPGSKRLFEIFDEAIFEAVLTKLILF